ncbi:MAG TPA: tripartite tricarboxylate transporter TctB family protein [Burkholderiaceae bacterium]|nr:tripartite tricarboxylate transporter TctB family protein [Burkholderiaceae bacterium]
MKRYDIGAGLLLLLLSAVVMFDARRLEVLPVGSGTFPVLLAAILAVCALLLIGGHLARLLPAAAAPEWPSGDGSMNVLIGCSVTALYIAAIAVVGFLPATFVFVVAMLSRISRYRWLTRIAIGALIAGLATVGFGALGVSLPAF